MSPEKLGERRNAVNLRTWHGRLIFQMGGSRLEGGGTLGKPFWIPSLGKIGVHLTGKIRGD